MTLAGRGAVVTGGSRGIGRAIVERLARDGASVVFGYRENQAAATAVEQAVAQAGGTAHAVRADLAEPDAVERLFAAAGSYFDGLDILVCNAGTTLGATPIADVDLADYDRLMAVNTRSVFVALQHAARSMRDGGRIITISSLNTAAISPATSVYTASKGAVEFLTRVVARELGPRGITANIVSRARPRPSCSGRATRPRAWPWPPGTRRSAGSASRPTWPMSSASWPARTAGG